MKLRAKGGLILAAVAAVAVLAVPALANLTVGSLLAGDDDKLPGIALPSSPVTGALDGSVAGRDYDDVYAVHLRFNQRLSVQMTGSAGTDFDLWLWKPGSPSLSVANPLSYVVQASSTEGTSTERFWYPASTAGTHSVDVVNWNDSRGKYELTWDIVQLPAPQVVSSVPSYVKWGAQATITGTATMNGAGLDRPRIMIAARAQGAKRWSHLNKDRDPDSDTYGMPLTVADEDGVFSYAVRPTKPTEYRAIVWPTFDRGRVNGAVTLVSPRATLTTPQAPKEVKRGSIFTVKGYLSPKHKVGAREVKVRFYQQDPATKDYVLRKTVHATNYASTVYPDKTLLYRRTSLPSKGKWKIVMYVPGDAQHASGTSAARYVTVK